MPTITILRLSALLAVWLLILASPAPAATPLVEIKDLKQPVAAGSPTTYADLLKLVFPEPPTGQEEAPQPPPVRQINDYYKKQPLSVKQGLGGVMVLPLKAQNQRLLLLLVSATGERPEEEGEGGGRQYDLLALVQTAPVPRLLDLMDIGQGQIIGQVSGFWTANPLLDLTPATQACMIFQEHFNSSQSYLHIHLLWVRNQRLEEVLSVSPFGNRSLCATFRSKAVFLTDPDKGREYPKVVAKLTVKMEPSPKDGQCRTPQRGFTKSYQDVWQWDPAKQKYQQTSRNLDRLYKFYEKYY